MFMIFIVVIRMHVGANEIIDIIDNFSTIYVLVLFHVLVLHRNYTQSSVPSLSLKGIRASILILTKSFDSFYVSDLKYSTLTYVHKSPFALVSVLRLVFGRQRLTQTFRNSEVHSQEIHSSIECMMVTILRFLLILSEGETNVHISTI